MANIVNAFTVCDVTAGTCSTSTAASPVNQSAATPPAGVLCSLVHASPAGPVALSPPAARYARTTGLGCFLPAPPAPGARAVRATTP